MFVYKCLIFTKHNQFGSTHKHWAYTLAVKHDTTKNSGFQTNKL